MSEPSWVFSKDNLDRTNRPNSTEKIVFDSLKT